eukprot:m.98670 g.98670  ORF g.98670 m.98670 type:complete len:226 (-) comp15289_c0_seq2:201-878(-)
MSLPEACHGLHPHMQTVAKVLKDNEGWSQVKETSDGFKVEQKPMNDCPVHCVRAFGFSEASAVDLADHVDAIHQLDHTPREVIQKYLNDFKSGEMLSTKPRVAQFVIKLPFPLSLRELVCEFNRTTLPGTETIVCTNMSVEHPDYVPSAGAVLAQPIINAFVFTPHESGKGTNVVRIAQMRPGGSIPSFVANLASSKILTQTKQLCTEWGRQNLRPKPDVQVDSV